jgi:hypothetical protein
VNHVLEHTQDIGDFYHMVIRLTVGWISWQYIHHYFAKIKVEFAT